MAQTPATWDDYVGDGVEDTYQVTFPYQKEQEVFAYVDEVPATFTFISEGWVQFDAVPANGAAIRIQRNTEAFEPRHEFASGVPLLPRFIDENNKQFLYVLQEAVNETVTVAEEALTTSEEALTVAQAASDKVDAATIDSAHQLRLDLANSSDPEKGAGQVGWVRSSLSETITSVGGMLSAQWVSVWEFANLITSKPNPADPETWDWTPAVQGAIDAAATSHGGWTVVIPAGVYPITRIVRKRGVKMVGMGSRSTAFVALPFAPGSAPFGMVEIDNGPVAGAGMEGIAFYGSSSAIYGAAAVNANQWGFYCHAKYDAGNVQGGFWHSQDVDVAYWNFNYGIWSRGGYTDANSLRPNQFIDFINIQVGVQSGGTAWRFTGQHGQINLINGYGEGLNPAGFAYAAIAVEITWDPDPSTTAVDGVNGESTSDVAGVGNAARVPTNISLMKGFALQKARKAILCKGATRNIDIDGCWIEKVAEAINLENSASLSVRSARFANAADGSVAGAAGTGHIIKQLAGTLIEWGDGIATSGVIDSFMSSSSASNNDIAGYSFKGPLSITATSSTLFPARGAKAVSIDAGGVIDVGAHPLSLVSNNADHSIRLIRIDGRHLPGQQLILRAAGGPFTLRSTGNIVTGANRDVTVPSGGLVILQRLMPTTTGIDWVLVSVTTHNANAAPADGFYYARGHQVWSTTPAVGGSPGWVCTSEGLAGSTAVFRAMANLA